MEKGYLRKVAKHNLFHWKYMSCGNVVPSTFSEGKIVCGWCQDTEREHERLDGVRMMRECLYAPLFIDP